MRSIPRSLRWLMLALLLYTSGCAASQETAVVTDRPEPPVTEAPPAVQPETPAPAPVATEVTDDIQPGRFDKGKMWTFDNPPLDYFQEAYGFRPDSAWFSRARLGALRIPGCSASFVSPNGLVLTNHHCGRSHVTKVSRAGENLLDNGFYAAALDQERKVDELYAEQLIAIRDVTADVYKGAEGGRDPAQARQEQADQIETRLTAEAKTRDTTLTVEVIELYSGGRYSAYTFKRYNDVRLVMAPELDLGSFGGDPDNFTYPRYSLDFSLFRVYGTDGKPFASQHFFPWSTAGLQEGDAVFVVGNPGTTSRLGTAAQLVHERDFEKPHELELFRSRSAAIAAYVEREGERADSFDLRNTLLALQNERKRVEGELAGLRDPHLIARRRAADARLQQAIQQTDSLRAAYSTLFREIEELQRSKQATAQQAAAFTYFASPIVDSHVLIRAVYGYIYSLMRQRGAPSAQLADIRKEALAVEDWPAELETTMLGARLRELHETLGAADPTVSRVLGGRTPEQAAAEIVSGTALVDSARYVQLLEKGYLSSNDPSVTLAEALTPLYFTLLREVQGLTSQEEELNARLALAGFAVYGTQAPPDATFSLRIADGVVRGYPYNGTQAPPFTTFYGLFNHYYTHGGEGTDWDLTERWLTAPSTFDRSTPFNLVSTNDIVGGNSGSPLLNRDLQLVGLIFDSNMEGLPNTYLYTDDRARAISVDARGILEVLDDIYDADRIVVELTAGTLHATEAAADEARR